MQVFGDGGGKCSWRRRQPVHRLGGERAHEQSRNLEYFSIAGGHVAGGRSWTWGTWAVMGLFDRVTRAGFQPGSKSC